MKKIVFTHIWLNPLNVVLVLRGLLLTVAVLFVAGDDVDHLDGPATAASPAVILPLSSPAFPVTVAPLPLPQPAIAVIIPSPVTAVAFSAARPAVTVSVTSLAVAVGG